jgi:hypothetical protein
LKDNTYEEYKDLADRTFQSFYEIGEKDNIGKIEEDYWKTCNDEESNSFLILENVNVQYAADLPYLFYFNNEEYTNLIKQRGDMFNLLNVNFQKNSLLQFLNGKCEEQISGITIPWLYYGMLFSSFCWHTEDLYLYSLNYMHEGASKIWYSISAEHKEKMDEYIKAKYYATLLKQPDLIHKLTIHINPIELIENGIKVYRTVQKPGEIIVTLPKGYHAGFSTGLNIAEAVNFSVRIY